MNILEQIVAERRTDVERRRSSVPERELSRRAGRRTHHGMAKALSGFAVPRIIAEVKKASPSAGLLKPDYDPAATARAFAAAGAAGISVLTEPLHFLGSDEHLVAVRNAVDLPVLRKDFVCDEYQVLEAAALGADCILLIVAVLSDRELAALYACASGLGLDVLVEAHTRDELTRALELDGAIVGVNSRNLKTLKTDLGIARELAAHIPAGRLAVAESGIRTAAEVRELMGLGYRGFLVGESLARSADAGDAVRALLCSAI